MLKKKEHCNFVIFNGLGPATNLLLKNKKVCVFKTLTCFIKEGQLWSPKHLRNKGNKANKCRNNKPCLHPSNSKINLLQRCSHSKILVSKNVS